MQLTQQIVDWAKGRGYKLRTQALYETRKTNEVFLHPNTGYKMVLSRETVKGIEFLTHKEVRDNI